MSVLRSDRLPPLLLAVFAALGALPVVRSLLVADLNWCYPYVTSDSYDWIANGLSWAGENVAASWRPPGLSLFISALFKLGLLSWLPVANARSSRKADEPSAVTETRAPRPSIGSPGAARMTVENVAPGVAVCMRPSGSFDQNAKALLAVDADLCSFGDARGRRLKVLSVPSPGIVTDGAGSTLP